MRAWVQIYGTWAWLYMSGILAKGEIWRLAALLWSLAHRSSQLLNSVCKERPCLKKIRWSVIVEGTERKPLACLHMHKHLPLATATTLFIVRTPNTMLFPSILTYSCTPLVRTGLRLCLPRSPLTSGAAFSRGYDRERISKKKKKGIQTFIVWHGVLESPFPLPVEDVHSMPIDKHFWHLSELHAWVSRSMLRILPRCYLEWDSKMISSVDPLDLRQHSTLLSL